MDLVLDDRTANMAHHAYDLLLVVIHCLCTSCLAFLHRMVRLGSDLRCEHLLRHWLMLHWLHLEIRGRNCKVAQLGELAWTENRLCLLLLLRLDTIILLL